MTDEIKKELIDIALQKVSGTDFEDFCNPFMANLLGESFVPLGGMHDGGADGFDEESIYECNEKNKFYQFSISKGVESKITGTIKRIKIFGRTITHLTYVTNQTIQYLDKVEDKLSEKLDCRIRIRDKKYIESHINNSMGTIAAYKNYLSQYTAFLRDAGNSSVVENFPSDNDPTMYTFLQQEIDSRKDNLALIKRVTDSLILWALNETDPDKGNFLTRDEIVKKILRDMPWTKQFIKTEIDERLEELYKRGGEYGREIRRYKKENKYCLPIDTRDKIEEENSVDYCLKSEVLNEIKASIREMDDLEKELNDKFVD